MPFDPLVPFLGIYSPEIIRNVFVLAAYPGYYPSIVCNSELSEAS